eukprot:scaffold187360_cov48-Prasinocladus_malaysianus.AAC.1
MSRPLKFARASTITVVPVVSRDEQLLIEVPPVWRGSLVSRSESFLVGVPMDELAIAAKHSQHASLTMAPSSWQYVSNFLLGEVFDDRFVNVKMADIHTAVHSNQSSLLQSFANFAKRSESQSSQLSSNGINNVKRTTTVKVVENSATLADRLAQRVEVQVMRFLASQARQGQQGGEDQTVPSDSATAFKYAWDTAGRLLEPLLLHVPGFVRDRCLAGQHTGDMAEIRDVTILHFTCQAEGIDTANKDLHSLKALLSQMIDIAEGGFGAATLQKSSLKMEMATNLLEI